MTAPGAPFDASKPISITPPARGRRPGNAAPSAFPPVLPPPLPEIPGYAPLPPLPADPSAPTPITPGGLPKSSQWAPAPASTGSLPVERAAENGQLRGSIEAPWKAKVDR